MCKLCALSEYHAALERMEILTRYTKNEQFEGIMLDKVKYKNDKYCMILLL